MKRIKILVASALILSSMSTLVACGKDSKGEEVASVDTAVEETETQEEETPKEEVSEENKENAEEVKEEVKEEAVKSEEIAKAQAEPVKENTNSTSQSSNNVQNKTKEQTQTQKQPQQQVEQPQKKQETPKYRVGEVIPTPDGEVYHTTIHGSAITTTERRLDNSNGIISGSEQEGFHNEYKIYDTSVAKVANETKEYHAGYDGYNYTEVNWHFKGLKKGKTRVTVSFIETSTGDLRYNTEYYLEVDENLNVYVFLPGNGLEI